MFGRNYFQRRSEALNREVFPHLLANIERLQASPHTQRLPFGEIGYRGRLYMQPHATELTRDTQFELRFGEARRTYVRFESDVFSSVLHLGELATFTKLSTKHWAAQIVATGSPRWEEVFLFRSDGLLKSYVGDLIDEAGQPYRPTHKEAKTVCGVPGYEYYGLDTASPSRAFALNRGLEAATPISEATYQRELEELKTQAF